MAGYPLKGMQNYLLFSQVDNFISEKQRNRNMVRNYTYQLNYTYI